MKKLAFVLCLVGFVLLVGAVGAFDNGTETAETWLCCGVGAAMMAAGYFVK